MSSTSNNGTISIPVGAVGATGASGITAGAVGAVGGYTSIITTSSSGSVFGGGGLTSASISGTYTTVSKPVYYTESTAFENDIVINRKDGETIRVGQTIKAILDTFYIIIPDQKLLDTNPSLKTAYDHHQAVMQETLGDQLKDSYNSYKTIEKLVLDSDDQTDI
jgi:hypothetical protein